MDLPTPAQILAGAAAELDRAYQALGDVADWHPDTGGLTADQAHQRRIMREAISRAKETLARARG